jgi:hypothetical protein
MLLPFWQATALDSGAASVGVLSALRPSLLAGAAMSAALLAWQRLGPGGNGPLALFAAFAIGTASYLVVLWMVQPGLIGEARRALRPRPRGEERRVPVMTEP